MILLPIRTEMVARRTPLANYLLLFANCVVFLLFRMARSDAVESLFDRLNLHADWPAIHQFFTYQFLHADVYHLLGNMLFLWVFGNSVNAKMGDLPYLLFYLASGVFAAVVFAMDNDNPLIGASGAVAGITTAYLVLFPRSHVTVLLLFFFIQFFEVPAMILIGVKIILWDNVISPNLTGPGNVAFSAHLGGYLFGFGGASVMLLLHAISRDQFDMLALMDRWNRRRVYRSMMSTPEAQQRARFGTVARPVSGDSGVRAADHERFDEISGLRAEIAECIEQGDVRAAAALYAQLLGIDPEQCLPARQQLLVAREFYSAGRAPQAAAAFERYLKNYPNVPEADEIRLLLGIIYARDLQQYSIAEQHLESCMQRLSDGARRLQCREWLDVVRRALGKPVADA